MSFFEYFEDFTAIRHLDEEAHYLFLEPKPDPDRTVLDVVTLGEADPFRLGVEAADQIVVGAPNVEEVVDGVVAAEKDQPNHDETPTFEVVAMDAVAMPKPTEGLAGVEQGLEKFEKESGFIRIRPVQRRLASRRRRRPGVLQRRRRISIERSLAWCRQIFWNNGVVQSGGGGREQRGPRGVGYGPKIGPIEFLGWNSFGQILLGESNVAGASPGPIELGDG